MDIRVSGHRDLFSFATALHAGSRDLYGSVTRGLRNAAQIVADEVLDDPHTQMPSGYRPVFTRDLEVKPEVRLIRSHTVRIVGEGKSRTKGRDVVALNQGRLRHPVFGRYRRALRRSATKTVAGKQMTIAAGSAYKNPWVLQTIKPGWWDDPVNRARPRALKAIQASVDDVVKKINERA